MLIRQLKAAAVDAMPRARELALAASKSETVEGIEDLVVSPALTAKHLVSARSFTWSLLVMVSVWFCLVLVFSVFGLRFSVSTAKRLSQSPGVAALGYHWVSVGSRVQPQRRFAPSALLRLTQSTAAGCPMKLLMGRAQVSKRRERLHGTQPRCG